MNVPSRLDDSNHVGGYAFLLCVTFGGGSSPPSLAVSANDHRSCRRFVDSRGYFSSEGAASVLSEQDGVDFDDAIEWAGSQPWSNGNVGLNGVSYLAIAQWAAASTDPPHLKAIVPWEGQTDAFREVL